MSHLQHGFRTLVPLPLCEDGVRDGLGIKVLVATFLDVREEAHAALDAHLVGALVAPEDLELPALLHKSVVDGADGNHLARLA